MRLSRGGRIPFSIVCFVTFSLGLLCMPPQLWAAVGNLETPTSGSFQSGIDVIRGWVCSANQVTIKVNDTISVPAVYGEIRVDTQSVCGDANNGFTYQINWNRLGEGAHTVRVLADGEEFGRATIVVATLGRDVFRGAQGDFPVQPFPQAGQTTRLRWQESRQQFVLANNKWRRQPTNRRKTGRPYSRIISEWHWAHSRVDLQCNAD